MQLERGTLIADRYRVERRVGTGAMGEVWAAQRLSDGRNVALKVLLGIAANERESLARFRREAQVLARVRSEYVSEVLDFFTDDDLGMILVMELVPGKSLHHILWEEKTLSVEAALDVAADVLRGLKDLHDANIVHRDLKPGNIVLKPGEGLRDRAIVIDFGVSRIISSAEEEEVTAITRAGRVLGTLEYMAPEQILGSRTVTPTADLYALGAILFRAIAGHHVYRDLKEGRLALAKLNEDAQPLDLERDDTVAQQTTTFVGRLLARRSRDRFESTEEALAALAQFREPTVEQPKLEAWDDDDIDLAETVVRQSPLLGTAGEELARTWVAGQPPPSSPEQPAPAAGTAAVATAAAMPGGEILDEVTVERSEPSSPGLESSPGSRPPPLPQPPTPALAAPLEAAAPTPSGAPAGARIRVAAGGTEPGVPSARTLAADAEPGPRTALLPDAEQRAAADLPAGTPASEEPRRRPRWRTMGSVVVFSALGAFGGAVFGISYLQGGGAYDFVNSLRSAVVGSGTTETAGAEPAGSLEPTEEGSATEPPPDEEETPDDSSSAEPDEPPTEDTADVAEPATAEPAATPEPPPPRPPPRPPTVPRPPRPPPKPPATSPPSTSPGMPPGPGTGAPPKPPTSGTTATPEPTEAPKPPDPAEHEPTEL